MNLYKTNHKLKLKKQSIILGIIFVISMTSIYAQNPTGTEIQTVEWQTHRGTGMPYVTYGASAPGSVQTLQQLDAAGSSLTDLDADSVGSTRTGDLIELGFFDTDATSTITPNTSTTDLFHGIWTPITTQTTIGQNTENTTVGAGLFGFETQYANRTGSDAAESFEGTARTNTQSEGANFLIVDDTIGTWASNANDLSARVTALNAASSPLVGIRFYDGGISGKDDSVGATRYNTIMNQNWVWPSGGNTLKLALYDTSGNMDSNLKFEFQNSTYKDGSSYEALIGTGGSNNVSPTSGAASDTNDFVATVTYHDGDDNLNLANSGGIGDAILSGLNGSGDFGGANDGNQLTVHSNSGNDGEYVFSGNIYTDGSTSTDLTIFKTGSGEQTFSGNINTSDSDTTESGYLNVAEGSLTLKPGSGKTQKFEYLTGAATGGTLTLNNADESTQTIELGFANTAEKKTYSGTLTLSGSGTNIINIGGSAGTFASGDAHQELSGAISGSAGLKKTGTGKLTLTGDSGSFGGGVTIADGGGAIDGGIVLANHANGLGTGTTVVEHGKLSVAGGITVTNTIEGQGTNNTAQKSVVGGGSGTSVGTITNAGAILNIGSGNGEIDSVSPGIALSSSLSSGTSTQQSIVGDHNDAGVDTLAQSIGIVKINSVGLKSGGVYDWEISNFAGSAGSDWDVLEFDSLAFDSSGNFDLNILSLTSDDGAGSGAGAVAGTLSDKSGTSGFKFLDGSGSNGSGITWGSIAIGGSQPSTSGTLDSGYFDIGMDNFGYNNNYYYGDWSVYLDYANNDFYMQYSVVPEPSTYIMVAGLLMLPGMSYLRRLRKSESEEESTI